MRWIWLALPLVLLAGCQPETRIMEVHCRTGKKFNVIIKGRGPTIIQHAMKAAMDVCEGKAPEPTPGPDGLRAIGHAKDMGDDVMPDYSHPDATYSPQGTIGFRYPLTE